MNILSIQSSVAYGHVGNAAAVLPLQLLGHTVWPVDTVSFSNHPAYGAWRGRVHDADAIADIIDGLADRGALDRCDAVLSGYLGTAATGSVVLEAAARIKQANPAAIFALDPVMGDDAAGQYVAAGIPELFRDAAVRAADIVLPNRFELAWLTGRTVTTVADAAAAARELRAMGPGTVVATGVREGGGIATVVADAGGASVVRTPYLEVASHGAGDAFSALFVGHYLVSKSPEAALECAVSSVYGLLKATREEAADALALVAARREIAAPTESFSARPIE